MKKILVTGGAGYIGSHIVEQLIKLKKKVIIIDNLSTGHKRLINKKALFFNFDIKNFKKLNKIISKYHFDSIFHLAACLSVEEAEKKPTKYYNNNVIGTKNIINVCKKNQIKNLIFSSSCAVYKDKIQQVNEKSKLKPKGIYGNSKFLAEKLIIKELYKTKIKYAILRYFNVAGASESGKIGQITRGDQLFKNLSLASIKKKPKIYIYGNNYKTKDKTCVRDYIHVSDIAKIHLLTLSRIKKLKKSIILNCGYGKGVSVLEAVNEFQNQIKKNILIKYKKRRKGDMEKIISNNSRIKNFLKWSPPKNPLRIIVKSCINWEKKISKQY